MTNAILYYIATYLEMMIKVAWLAWAVLTCTVLRCAVLE